jgi:opacity protein-like surface antigen
MITKRGPTNSIARGLLASALLIIAALPLTLHGAELISVGANFVPDLEVNVTGTPSSASGTFDIKTGFRGTLGYEFVVHDLLSVELESGFLYNEIDNEGIAGFDAWFGQVPALVNLVFHYQFESGWTPFAGIGGGVTASILDFSFTSGGSPVEESNVTLVPAWQVLGGLRYRFNDNWAMDVVYKYLETGGPEIRVGNEKFRFDTVHNHFVGLQLNYSY